MKKVLVITYYWPPSGGAGVQRWLKFVKYLRGFGWEPVIYTPSNPESPEFDNSLLEDVPEGLEVIRKPIREPYSAYKKFLGQKQEEKIQAGFISEKKKNPLLENISIWIRGNLFIPDARVWWIKPSVKFLLEYLKNSPVDAIVSTGPPHSMHLIALGIRERLNIPWLADFRDPWTGIDFYDKLKLTKWADRKHRKLEKKVLKKAEIVTTVSWGCEEGFKKIINREYQVITNGFDPDDFKGIHNVPDPHFCLTHLGSLNKDRNPDFLWSVLSDISMKDEEFRKDLRLRFIGKNDISLTESLVKYGLSEASSIESYLPHDSVVNEASRSQILLLLLNDTPNAKGIISGKLFEYLATGRPVLAIGPPDGDAAKIIRETNSGVICDFNDKENLKEIILDLYSKYKRGQLNRFEGNIQDYSRKELTAKMAALLDRIS